MRNHSAGHAVDMFGLFNNKPAPPAEYKQQAMSAFEGVRAAAAQVSEHLGALSELFAAELQEYMQAQVRRICLLAAACVLLAGAYLVACALLSVVLQLWLGWIGALSLVLGLHLLGAFLLIRLAGKYGRMPFAPATIQELKNDKQCLALMIKPNANKP